MNLSKTVQALVSRLRSLLRHLWIYALYMCGALARAKRRIRSDEGALVLTLHRILPDHLHKTTLSPPGMVMSERTFASMVRYLSAEHRVFSLDVPWKSTRTDPRIAIAITFDDGWADNAAYAQRILARHAMPAAIFLCPERMGKTLPFWPEKLVALIRAATQHRREEELLAVVRECARLPEIRVNAHASEVIEAVKHLTPGRREMLFERLERMGFGRDLDDSAGSDSTMSWEDARTLSKDGFLLGSHTLHHEILTRIPIEKAREEIRDSRIRLDREIGRPCFAFAYPNGDWSPEVRAVTASAGYALAFANKPGVWTAQTDPFAVPRIGLWEGAVTGLRGRFSRAHFEYVVFWKTLRELEQQRLAGPLFDKNEQNSSFRPRAA
jgi:peptidoglycan/xylan/chitin deacetylase (PgdA/CDA1 family)